MNTPAAPAPRLLGGSTVTVEFPTLDEIKTVLGIPAGDSSKDQQLTDLINATVAMIETYLGRGIAFARITQEFGPIETRDPRLFLSRYPVQQVHSVTVDGQAQPADSYWLYPNTGILQWRAGCGCTHFMSRACARDVLALVDYEGGYPDDAWPPDLCEAVMRTFYARWAALASSAGSVPPAAGAPVKAWTADGLSIQYDTATQPGLGELASSSIPADLLPVAAMLDGYRARRVPGV